MGTVKRIGWRLLLMLPILALVSVLAFLIGVLTPGDPIEAQYANRFTAEQLDQIRATYGLDLPLWQQYFVWLKNVAVDGGGISIVLGVPVFDILGPNFLNTLILTLGGVVACVVFGMAIGATAGIFHRTWIDRAVMLIVQIGSNLSIYWFGLVLIIVFSLQLQWLPVGGMQSRNGGGFADLLAHLVLPSLAAGLISMLVLARFVRIGIIHEVGTEHFKTFASQGIPRWKLYGKHVGRNILPSAVNITGLEIGTLITGVIFVESVFNWPGIGTQLLNAVNGKDYPVIQGGILLVAACYLVVNLLTDITVDSLNPRLRRA
ncbi:ABC transporter permease [Sediminivirga luteola]|uniref:Glutathione ABC transporter permease n=1 Tax=Sediminivirga luteola TaxID=1774748 RepID=A0A8J2TZ87_9MICO|nr:ABC transporter permease [Sediminivirga luteola]MCI2266335.1 ABC transporter permease [Sediminivirga luteola]GGA19933.1 glutathione ABC transporter permease [Sediminivirga luteola]